MFTLERSDDITKARAGCFKTNHGKVLTPIFMPVGTQAAVKAVSPQELYNLGAQIILGNTYHLYLRPGDDLIREAGGLHHFMDWSYPILTDSGGYQVYSLSNLCKIKDEGAHFQSHIDGSYHMFTPESVIDIQRNLGSDIIMVLDECSPYPCEYKEAMRSNDRTLRWAERALKRIEQTASVFENHQDIFGIVQGSTYEQIRRVSAERLVELNFNGYAIGGLAVGEPKSAMIEMVDLCTDLLPSNKPRYLMGIGKPEDIVEGIKLGVDMFDCVIPTRNGRNGTVYTKYGKLVVRNSSYKRDFQKIEEDCECYTCNNFSRAYIHHLFQADEILGLRLASIHNLHFYMKLVSQARQAILNGKFSHWIKMFYSQYQNNN
jgi:queuine tRNA-ribosyltransferase